MSTPLTRRRLALEDVNTVERNVQRPPGTPANRELEYCLAAGESTTTDP